MEDKKKDVPFYVYDLESAKQERTVKRLVSIIILLIVMLVASNLAWLYVFNQYDISSEQYTIEGQDNANANYLESGVEGVINNGE